MKLFCCSDLHLDFHIDGGRDLLKKLCNEKIDYIVIAGDLSNYFSIKKSLKILLQYFPNVIYVPGNHEYHGSSIEQVNESLKNIELKNNNLHILISEKKIIDGINFIGTTLWFRKTQQCLSQKSSWIDFRSIAYSHNSIFGENEKACSLIAGCNNEDIVITHHLPSQNSVVKEFIGYSTNCYFVCDLDDLILEKQPRYWIHGHTHVNKSYNINKTQIICNPFGYPGENPNFQNKLIIEV